MSEIVIAQVTQNNELADGVFSLRLELPGGYPQPEPGQFVNLYLNDPSLLLPRPISVCGHRESELTLVYAVVGLGTGQIAGYGAGTKIRVSTPLGNGFTPSGTGNCLLIGGGLGVPPMLFLARRLAAQGREDVRAVLGFRSRPFLAGEFPCEAQIATDDGCAGFKGNVTELLEGCDIPADTQLFACGPKPMLSALASFAAARELPLQVSLEERMGCGYGACVGCVCKTVGGNRKVCEHGPVFDSSEVIWGE